MTQKFVTPLLHNAGPWFVCVSFFPRAVYNF